MNFVFKIKVFDKSGAVMVEAESKLSRFRADKLSLPGILGDLEDMLVKRYPDGDKTEVHLVELIDCEGIKYVPKKPVMDMLDAAEHFFDGEAVQWIPEHLKDRMEALMNNMAIIRQQYE
ncbi:hypothetical protein [Lacihabitans soyangensis]|uniref:Uncharacterized protein n=1 Tax=Lacihabitans soyangensis TaxID=869394 RepID=A0AAE3H6M7_9BACT|nr:hypothetical protein [Lacihabitans soyangensis]MCP9764956.1 hypothetical protein [Lacihabitans soyangensis]